MKAVRSRYFARLCADSGFARQTPQACKRLLRGQYSYLKTVVIP